MSIKRCRTCARCAGGRTCRYKSDTTKGCTNFVARVNPYSEKKTEKAKYMLLGDEDWASFKKVDIDDPGD